MISGALAVASTSVVGISAVSAGTAYAADACTGKSTNHVVKNFYRGPRVIPLRCGTSTWGYRHLLPKHGYNSAMIANTVSRGGERFGFYYLNLNQCPPMKYKVVFNPSGIGGSGPGPQGVITAYYEAGHQSLALSC